MPTNYCSFLLALSRNKQYRHLHVLYNMQMLTCRDYILELRRRFTDALGTELCFVSHGGFKTYWCRLLESPILAVRNELSINGGLYHVRFTPFPTKEEGWEALRGKAESIFVATVWTFVR